jgi:hypothetical protein
MAFIFSKSPSPVPLLTAVYRKASGFSYVEGLPLVKTRVGDPDQEPDPDLHVFGHGLRYGSRFQIRTGIRLRILSFSHEIMLAK